MAKQEMDKLGYHPSGDDGNASGSTQPVSGLPRKEEYGREREKKGFVAGTRR